MSPPSPAWRRRKNRPRRASYPKDGCIRPPLQGAGPRKGFVARQGRPEARRASAGASAEAYGQYAAQASDEHARRSPGIACRSRKGSPLGDRRLRLGLHRQPFVGLPAPGSAYRKYACAVLGRPSRSGGASASPRLPTLPGTGPSLRLRCTPSLRGGHSWVIRRENQECPPPSSVVRLAGSGASTSSVRHPLCDMRHAAAFATRFTA